MKLFLNFNCLLLPWIKNFNSKDFKLVLRKRLSQPLQSPYISRILYFFSRMLGISVHYFSTVKDLKNINIFTRTLCWALELLSHNFELSFFQTIHDEKLLYFPTWPWIFRWKHLQEFDFSHYYNILKHISPYSVQLMIWFELWAVHEYLVLFVPVLTFLKKTFLLISVKSRFGLGVVYQRGELRSDIL